MITSGFISNIFSRKFETDLIILRMDGGICSQISFWALGNFYAESGFQVKFDMSWFIKNGLDMDGKFARNFDFCKLFPELKIRAAKKFECKLGRNKYGIDGSVQSPEKLVAPAYIYGYPERWLYCIRYRSILRQNILASEKSPSVLRDNNLQNILNCEFPVAVHVRRGDLSTFNPTYGEPPDSKYFVDAIKLVKDAHPNSKFFFFSDELDWVRDNIFPEISEDTNYSCIVGNGSDKGYLDLLLMSKCKAFVSSQGSLGKYARLLHSDDALIIEPKSHPMFTSEMSDNVVII